jgi:hypothetical protein
MSITESIPTSALKSVYQWRDFEDFAELLRAETWTSEPRLSHDEGQSQVNFTMNREVCPWFYKKVTKAKPTEKRWVDYTQDTTETAKNAVVETVHGVKWYPQADRDAHRKAFLFHAEEVKSIKLALVVEKLPGQRFFSWIALPLEVELPIEGNFIGGRVSTLLDPSRTEATLWALWEIIHRLPLNHKLTIYVQQQNTGCFEEWEDMQATIIKEEEGNEYMEWDPVKRLIMWCQSAKLAMTEPKEMEVLRGVAPITKAALDAGHQILKKGCSLPPATPVSHSLKYLEATTTATGEFIAENTPHPGVLPQLRLLIHNVKNKAKFIQGEVRNKLKHAYDMGFFVEWLGSRKELIALRESPKVSRCRTELRNIFRYHPGTRNPADTLLPWTCDKLRMPDLCRCGVQHPDALHILGCPLTLEKRKNWWVRNPPAQEGNWCQDVLETQGGEKSKERWKALLASLWHSQEYTMHQIQNPEKESSPQLVMLKRILAVTMGVTGDLVAYEPDQVPEQIGIIRGLSGRNTHQTIEQENSGNIWLCAEMDSPAPRGETQAWEEIRKRNQCAKVGLWVIRWVQENPLAHPWSVFMQVSENYAHLQQEEVFARGPLTVAVNEDALESVTRMAEIVYISPPGHIPECNHPKLFHSLLATALTSVLDWQWADPLSPKPNTEELQQWNAFLTNERARSHLLLPSRLCTNSEYSKSFIKVLLLGLTLKPKNIHSSNIHLCGYSKSQRRDHAVLISWCLQEYLTQINLCPNAWCAHDNTFLYSSLERSCHVHQHPSHTILMLCQNFSIRSQVRQDPGVT